MKYEVGDRVVVVDKNDFMRGQVGTVVKIDHYRKECIDTILYQVEFDNGYVEPCYATDLEICNKIRGFEVVKNAPEDTLLPIKGSFKSAGNDFFAPYDIIIPAKGRTDNIFLNIKAYMQDDEYLELYIRSSLAVKHQIMLETSGVIDADYYSNPTTDGNISVVFRNNSDTKYIIKKGERCCQGIFKKYLAADNIECMNARIGGFGSTGR